MQKPIALPQASGSNLMLDLLKEMGSPPGEALFFYAQRAHVLTGESPESARGEYTNPGANLWSDEQKSYIKATHEGKAATQAKAQ